jgi:cytochrome P450
MTATTSAGSPPASGRPPGPTGLTASLRAMRALLTEPCRALDELAETHGRTFAMRAGPLRLMVVGNAELVGDVLSGRQELFRWRTAFRNLTVVTGRSSMIASDGDDHRRRRRLAQPAFARRRLDAWAPLIVRETDRAIEQLPVDATDDVDLHPVMRAVVRRVVVRILFGEDLASRSDEIGAALEPAMTYASRPLLGQLPHPLPIGARQAARRSRAAVDRMLDDEIVRRRRRAASPAEGQGDVLDILLAQADADGANDDEIRDQVVALVAAGHDTTSAAASWMLARILLTPGVAERLHDEASTALADPTAPGGLDRLPFADAVVRETLRLHPAGPIVPRYVVEAHDIGPYPVRPRTLLLWSPYLLGRDPAHWHDPTAFRPDRFTGGSADHVDGTTHVDGAAHDAVTTLAYLPFGAGPHKCIGFALAHMELQLIASRVAQRLRLEPRFDTLPPPTGMVVSRPDAGIPVTVRART